jgi:HEAT repeat protein
VAQNSNDLRVRAAAIEVYLAAYDLAKDSGSYYQLTRRAREEAGARPWALWMLGALGNRGVEPQGAFDTLREFARNRDEETRYWAVAGLGLLGTDETIEPLLEVFHNDPSPRVREHAACNLAQSGMLTHAQRMRAVPELLKFMDDPSLDPETQGWVYQALRDITGEWFGRNPAGGGSGGMRRPAADSDSARLLHSKGTNTADSLPSRLCRNSGGMTPFLVFPLTVRN